MTNIDELVYWNQNAYGSAIMIKKNWLRLGAVVLFIVTPFTNWMIPFIHRLIRNDIILRF